MQTKKGEEPLLKWADTKKASDWLVNHTSDVHAVGLSNRRIANKIKSFENPKQNDGNVEWINKGFATYIDKEKAHAFLSHLSAPIAETAVKAELDSATNIIDNFENLKQNGGNLRLRTSEELDRDCPNWNDTQTTSKGGHSTQITGTVSTSV